MKLFLVEGDYDRSLSPHISYYVVAENGVQAKREFREIFDRLEVLGCEEVSENPESIVRNKDLIVFCREKWDGE